MRVLFATSEAAPLIKTGGLADVSGALPEALLKSGIDVRLLIPGYGAVVGWVDGRAQTVAELTIPPFPPCRLLESTTPNGVPMLVIDCPDFYCRDGGPYQQATGADWPDNDVRFGLLSRVAALLAHESTPLEWRPDILHCNDWQTGLGPAYLAFQRGRRARVVMTIHNLAYQGIFLPGTMSRVGLPAESFQVQGVEYYGNVSYLKAGLFYADRITTVSPTYAQEIQREPLGFGMQGLLAWRSKDLVGILNGIDTDVWDPAADPLITRHYRTTTLARKNENKHALQEAMGLDRIAATPLLGVVSRFTYQKGLDLVLDVAERLIALPAQLAVLGSGDKDLEARFRALGDKHRGVVGVHVGFDEKLSHVIEAGADIFLMPSRYEPSGLNQMYSQRYGTPVVAHATGGLVDTVIDSTPDYVANGSATGFLFHDPTPEAILAAVTRAVDSYRNRRLWRALQRAAMSKDHSWAGAAGRYVGLYQELAPEV